MLPIARNIQMSQTHPSVRLSNNPALGRVKGTTLVLKRVRARRASLLAQWLKLICNPFRWGDIRVELTKRDLMM